MTASTNTDDVAEQAAEAVGEATDTVIVQPVELVQQSSREIIDGFFVLLPNIIAGLLVLLIAWLLGKVVARGVSALAARRDRPDLGNLLGSLAKGVLYVIAFLTATTIIFPSVEPVDVFGALGIGSVAIGFAFKDILQNLFAGLILLIQRPYKRGDYVKVSDFEGKIEHIGNRATRIRVNDGSRVVMPNADLYTSPVTLFTSTSLLRDELDIGVGYNEDPQEAQAIFLQVLEKIDGVLTRPPPEVIPWALNESTLDLRARWWINLSERDQHDVRGEVILAINEAAQNYDIDLPYPTQVTVLQDETDEDDENEEQKGEKEPKQPE